MTPPGIEPPTFRLVAQSLNQLRYGVSGKEIGISAYISSHKKLKCIIGTGRVLVDFHAYEFTLLRFQTKKDEHSVYGAGQTASVCNRYGIPTLQNEIL